MKKLVVFLMCVMSVFFLSGISTAQQSRALDVKKIDQVVEAGMKEWHVPGVALGIIKDGKIVYMKGYGYRDLENKLSVTPKTVMMIGSNTKSFNALMMAKLVDDKKIKWDDPVVKYLPEFRLKDVYATNAMTVKDLLIHDSGLPRHDLAWMSKPNETAKNLMERLPNLEPTATVRQKLQYQNLMYSTASYLQEKVTGQNWHHLMKDNFFVPLKMTSTTSTLDGINQSEERALAYQTKAGQVISVPYRKADGISGAGSINSNIEDMMQYVLFRLNRGKADNKQLISDALIDMTETVQMPLGDYFKGQIEADGYGLGLMIRANYQGHKWISHGGGIDGFTSAMSWLPNDKAGVVVLTNSESRLGGVIENTVIDELIGLKNKTDWVASQKEKEVLAKKTLEEKTASFWAKQVKATQPSHPLSAYTGVYENRGYGRVEVSEKDGQLMLSFDEFSTPLVHYHYDFFTVPKEEKEGLFSQFLTGNVVGFKTNEQGHIFLVSLPLEPSLPSPIEFTRVKVQD